MNKANITKRKRELNELFKNMPTNKKKLLSKTIDSMAFMDEQIKSLEDKLMKPNATTPDKQLYVSLIKSRDTLMKKMLEELPKESGKDSLAEFLNG